MGGHSSGESWRRREDSQEQGEGGEGSAAMEEGGKLTEA